MVHLDGKAMPKYLHLKTNHIPQMILLGQEISGVSGWISASNLVGR
jgi:hypothetical protein